MKTKLQLSKERADTVLDLLKTYTAASLKAYGNEEIKEVARREILAACADLSRSWTLRVRGVLSRVHAGAKGWKIWDGTGVTFSIDHSTRPMGGSLCFRAVLFFHVGNARGKLEFSGGLDDQDFILDQVARAAGGNHGKA